MHVLGSQKGYLFLPEKSKPGYTEAVPHASRGVPAGAAGVSLWLKNLQGDYSCLPIFPYQERYLNACGLIPNKQLLS